MKSSSSATIADLELRQQASKEEIDDLVRALGENQELDGFTLVRNEITI